MNTYFRLCKIAIFSEVQSLQLKFPRVIVSFRAKFSGILLFILSIVSIIMSFRLFLSTLNVLVDIVPSE